VWQPVTNERSISLGAGHGVNCFHHPDPTARLKKGLRHVLRRGPEAKLAGPTRPRCIQVWLDSDKKRASPVSRNVHLLLPGVDRDREWERVKLGMELEWELYGPFGFALVLAEPGDNFTMNTKITAEILAEKEVLIFGTPDEVAEKLLKVKEAGRL